MQRTRFSLSTLILTLMIMLAPDTSNAGEDNSLVRIMNERNAALVTVKYVLAINMGSRGGGVENESENELTCTMISAKGLVVCSSNQLTGFMDLIKQFAGPLGGEMSSSPRDLKVLIGEDDESFEAEIVAKDSELDMVWIRITDGGEKSFQFVDFSGGTQAGIGEPTLLIRRTGSNFGRTPVITRSYIGGISSKPRKLYIPGTPVMAGAGLPVFSADGRPIGLVVTQLPEAGESPTFLPGVEGSSMTNLQDAMSGLILPASDVVQAIQRATASSDPLQ